MAGQKFITQVAGQLQETVATQVGGVGAANLIPALDNTGRLGESMMPVGIAADTALIEATEALAAGSWVNIYNVGADVFGVRKADASAAGKEMHGFVLEAFDDGDMATVYFEGSNTQVADQKPGAVYLSAAVAGAGTDTPPTGAGQIVQRIGFATSPTVVNAQSGRSIKLA